MGEKRHECTKLGKITNDSKYDGNCTLRRFRCGTYIISGQLIFAVMRVPNCFTWTILLIVLLLLQLFNTNHKCPACPATHLTCCSFSDSAV
jgi:hypothetical protein